MNIVYSIAKSIVIIEFSLVAIIVLITFLLKLVIYLRNKQDKIISAAITDYLTNVDADINNFNINKFKRGWRKLNILLPITHKFEKKVEDKWEAVRISFFQSVMLPLARIDAISSNWTRRYYAAKVFSLFFEANDESYILKLVNDNVPLIRYNAIIPAILYGSEKSINSIISRMAQEPWLTQFLYLREFYNASGTSRIYIENHLVTSTNPDIRYVCYKLLLNYSPLKYTWNYQADINSNHMKLRCATLMFITYVDRESAIPLITRLLKDPDWHIRATSLVCIKSLKLHQAISEISQYLNDTNQWVSLVAMQVLYELGEQGQQVLTSKNITYNPIALDIMNQVIKT